MENENNKLNQISQDIIEMNNNALQQILEENIDSALRILNDTNSKLSQNTSLITDPKIQIIINHNLACCYQKSKNIEKCISHLEKVINDFDSFLQNKHHIQISQSFFINKISSDNSQPKVLLGDFILELRFCAKFHLQMCAAYSQNNDHEKALEHSKLAALICQDNIAKTFFLFKQIQKHLTNDKVYTKIFAEKVKENENIIKSLYQNITSITKVFNNPDKEILTEREIKNFINNKELKISMRNILGIIKNDDWLNLFNIGNIMFLCAMSYDDLDLDSDPKYELLRDAIIEKILMLTVAFFSISNELRFINQNNKSDAGSFFHSKALEISCIYLPSTCPIIKHYISSYIKNYFKGEQSEIIDKLLLKEKDEMHFDITKDPILNISQKEIKIIESSINSSNISNSNTNNNSICHPLLNRNDSGTQAKTERKREVKSAYNERDSSNGNHRSQSKNSSQNNNSKNNQIKGLDFYNMKRLMKNNNNSNNINNFNYGLNGFSKTMQSTQTSNFRQGYNFNKELFSFKKMMK